MHAIPIVIFLAFFWKFPKTTVAICGGLFLFIVGMIFEEKHAYQPVAERTTPATLCDFVLDGKSLCDKPAADGPRAIKPLPTRKVY